MSNWLIGYVCSFFFFGYSHILCNIMSEIILLTIKPKTIREFYILKLEQKYHNYKTINIFLFSLKKLLGMSSPLLEIALLLCYSKPLLLQTHAPFPSLWQSPHPPVNFPSLLTLLNYLPLFQQFGCQFVGLSHCFFLFASFTSRFPFHRQASLYFLSSPLAGLSRIRCDPLITYGPRIWRSLGKN